MKVHLTKEAAAQRLINAAIRMRFAGIDELAITVTAHAAFRNLADLLRRKRGREIVKDMFAYGLFSLGRLIAEGREPSEEENKLLDYAAFAEVAAEIAEHIKQGRIKEYTDIDLADFPDSIIKEYYKNNSEMVNFLKHADRDWGKTITIPEGGVDELLISAVAAYKFLMRRMEFVRVCSLGRRRSPRRCIRSEQRTGQVDRDALQPASRRTAPVLHRLPRR
jgi:hypothetical protein